MQQLRVSNAKGIVYAIISGVSFGFIPLFSLAAIHEGYTTYSILTYRFGIATILFAIMALIRGIQLRPTRRQLFDLFVLSCFCYGGSAFFLMKSYYYIPSGIATTINFLYPVMVALIMRFIFHEKLPWQAIVAVFLSLVGVAMLARVEGGFLDPRGIAYASMTFICYGLYVVGLNKLTVRSLPGSVVTFYVLLFTTIFFSLIGFAVGDLQPISSWVRARDFFLLALVATLISNFTLVLSVHSLGSTFASILGSVEPLTALGLGTLFLDEPLSLLQLGGAAVIVGAVVLVVLGNRKASLPPDRPKDEPGIPPAHIRKEIERASREER